MKVGKCALRLLVVALIAYAGATCYLVVRQRSYIYRPGTVGTATPADYHAPFESLRIPNNKGGELAAWWLAHPEPRMRPTLVYCHGNSANLSLLAEVASIFYSWGWNALLFDYRGYGNSSPAVDGFSEEGLMSDALTAYDWAKSHVEESNIIIWGHSLGSSVAANLASRNSPAGLVVEGAFPSTLKMARRRFPWAAIFPFMIFDRFDTASYAAKRSFPLLVMHAENDRIVPWSYGREVFEEAAPPKEWLLVPAIGHKDFPAVAAGYAGYFKDLSARWTVAASAREAK